MIDLFCGIGGLTYGLNKSGLKVKAGFDIDESCKYAYEYNNKAQFICKDIKKITGREIINLYSKDSIKVLAGCAPCQPFSLMSNKYHKNGRDNDSRYDLLLEFGRLIQEVQPDIVSMENIPIIEKTTIFKSFLKTLTINGYLSDFRIVHCPNYGIPQNRKRFVLLASKLNKIHLLKPTHKKENYITVRDTIGHLPAIQSEELNKDDILHQTAKLSDINLKRIQHSKPCGTWKDWPQDLKCKCHQKATGDSFTSGYGRINWDTVSPTITTQFYCYRTARYGHPEPNRALTLREGVLLQTFPEDYKFLEDGKTLVLKVIARAIGNAVSVKLGEVIGKSILNHINI